MKALIIEDEDLAAKRLKQLLLDIEPGLELSGPLDSIEESVRHLQMGHTYDIIFLDIQLADGKSFSIFDKINVNTPVIFTTAYDEYAIRAFELNSVDYLLKPVHKDKLRNAIDKFKKIKDFYESGEVNKDLIEMIKSMQTKASQVYKSRFLVNKGDALIPIAASEIAYFFAEDKVVFLTTAEGRKYLINYTLEELELKLNPQHFFRVNRQFISSLGAIKKVHNYFNYKLKLDLWPSTETEVIVSKARTTDFKAWMNGE
jgi:two-component system LytT family response regulator